MAAAVGFNHRHNQRAQVERGYGPISPRLRAPLAGRETVTPHPPLVGLKMCRGRRYRGGSQGEQQKKRRSRTEVED